MKFVLAHKCLITSEIFIMASLGGWTEAAEIIEAMTKPEEYGGVPQPILWPSTNPTQLKRIIHCIRLYGWKIDYYCEAPSRIVTELWFRIGEYERFIRAFDACREEEKRVSLYLLQKYRGSNVRKSCLVKV